MAERTVENISCLFRTIRKLKDQTPRNSEHHTIHLLKFKLCKSLRKACQSDVNKIYVKYNKIQESQK